MSAVGFFKNFLQADVIGSTLAVRLDCAVLPITYRGLYARFVFHKLAL